MNKFQFIKELLDTQKFSANQKERFLKLVSQELVSLDENDVRNAEDIKQIKDKLGLSNVKQEMKGKSLMDYLEVGVGLDEFINDSDHSDTKVRNNNLSFEEIEELFEDAGGKSIFENKPPKGKLTALLDPSKSGASRSNNLNDNSDRSQSLEESSTNGSEIRYVTYKNLPTFLRRLNSNDFTKFLTHSIDSTDISKLKHLLNSDVYNFELHLKKIKEVFDVLTIRDSAHKENFPDLLSYFLPKGIYTKIKQYIYGKTWSLENNIKMYWSHPNIKEWTIDNFGKAPSAKEESLNYEGFYFHSTAFNKQMSFCDLILFFKNEIHIRNTNSLYNLINNIYNNPNYSFKKLLIIENNVSDNLDFYTDVEKVRVAIRLILELIVEKHSLENKPIVIFNVSVGDEEITLSILHLGNSFVQNKETLRFGKSFSNLIDLLNGVCGLDILARFSDLKSYQLRLWEYGDVLKENTIYRDEKPLNLQGKLNPIKENIDGVQYNLTFNRGL